MSAAALLGKTPEAPEAPLGSGFDVQDMDEWTMWDIPLKSQCMTGFFRTLKAPDSPAKKSDALLP